MNQTNSRMTNKWRIFCSFIKRGARFLYSMKKRGIRRDFEQYLQTVGRDPLVYKQQSWSEIAATHFDTQ